MALAVTFTVFLARNASCKLEYPIISVSPSEAQVGSLVTIGAEVVTSSI
ncbi:MAG TPA: hypothetical protein VIH48_04715 [Candidatus Bathyarchaeia archaeon]